MNPPDSAVGRSLQAFNTLAVPSVAERYWRVSTTAELKEALRLARDSGMEAMILGGGSNVVLPERFEGLVIHMAIRGFKVVAEERDHVWLEAGAGEVWQDLVEYSLDHDFFGLENLSLIPGTVGAAPIQNIGAYGVELDSVFAGLKAVERESLKDVVFDRDACEFSYRDSVFKNRLKDTVVITSVTFKLNRKPQLNLSYAALREALADMDPATITPGRVSETVCRIRRSKLPDPSHIPNAGSFFKNPVVSLEQFKKLKNEYSDIVSYPVDDKRIKLAAAWLLDKAGWRGHSEGGVGMHVNQALVLVNPGHCSGERILQYAAKIQDDIQARFGITLEREPASY